MRLPQVWVLGGVALTTPIVAAVAPMGLNLEIAVAGLAALALLWHTGALRSVADTPLAALLVLLVAWAAASAAWAIVPLDALTTLRGVGLLLLGVLVLLALARHADDDGRRRIGLCLLLGIVAGTALVLLDGLTGLALSRGILAAQGSSREIFRNVLDRPAVVLSLLAFVAAIGVHRQWGWRFAVATLLTGQLPGLVASSSSARIAGAAGLLAVLAVWLAGRRLVNVLGVITVLLVLAAPLLPRGPLAPERWADSLSETKYSAMHRLLIWSFTAERIAEHPWRGWGLDAARSVPGGHERFASGGEKISLHPHNGSLQVWLELGLTGALLAGALLACIFAGCARIPDRFASAAASGAAVTGFVMAHLGFGIWQNWWLASLGLTAVLTIALAGARRTAVAENVDAETVGGFGAEWSRFDQTTVSADELQQLFAQYFSLFPWDRLPPDAVGFDLGVGSGRWARFVAPRVGRLHCIDASPAALDVARRALAGRANCDFHLASVAVMPLPPASMDFGYSLGVLHHVPDTLAGLRACAGALKPGAPFLVYLYYAFDNRPLWFRLLWRASDLGRRIISRLPFGLRASIAEMIAALLYWPLARLARLAEERGRTVDSWPLAAYRGRSFYTMRTDALDRFGTRLEQRFTREEIHRMLEAAGFTAIRFRDDVPYWCAVAFKQVGPDRS